MAESTVLNLVLWLPVLGMAVLALARRMSDRQVRGFTLAVMLVQLALTAWLLFQIRADRYRRTAAARVSRRAD